MITNKGRKGSKATIENLGIQNSVVNWNLTNDELIKVSLEKNLAQNTSTGAIAINTGEFTGRSPKDRFIVKDEVTDKDVWWSNFNIAFDPEKFDIIYNDVIKHMSNKELYVRDAYACADPKYKLNIRSVNELPWANLFVYNMFLRPTEEELENFTPEWTVITSPSFKADPSKHGTRQHNFAILNFTKKIALIGGTGYTGEIKKGIFSALNLILPAHRNVLSMHCSANIGKSGDTALFFGLSGTGKTTLSADPERKLIGDDEHGWSEESVFNFEGGCYAKCIDLTEEKEPDIFRAIKKGALLENIEFKPGTNEVDFSNISKTENTRVSYPIYHIDNISEPSIGPNPKNIFFLTCDANGVLPPISKLTPGQAAFHFISGYTAKVAGTEAGITEPVRTFSTCFGAPFMPLHPTRYADMLSKKMKQANANVWLINTGWSGGTYGVGKRMSLKITRALITAALNGQLDSVEYETHEIFGLEMPVACPNVPSEVLNPKNTWKDKDAYDKKANDLARAFNENFEKFKEFANNDILSGAPKVLANS